MQEMTLETIKKYCDTNRIRWTKHVMFRLIQRNIAVDEVVYALADCEIIEQYPEDHPYPSCLVLGTTVNQKPLHIVCGASDSELWLITAYYPEIEKWSDDFRVRRGDRK